MNIHANGEWNLFNQYHDVTSLKLICSDFVEFPYKMQYYIKKRTLTLVLAC